MVQSNSKKGNAFGRLFKSKKKASLSSQGMELRADDNTAGEEFLLNDSNGRKSGKSKFRRSRSKQDPTLISTSYSDKENQKSTSTAKKSSSLSRSEETHLQSQSDMYALSKEQVVTSSPQQSQFQPFYNFGDTHFDDDPAIFHKKSGASLLDAPSDETGDSFTNNPFNHKNGSMPASPKSPLSIRSKDSATASTPDAGFNCAFKDAWSVFCAETNATSNVQKNSETEVANRLQVRVDVLQNLQMSGHDIVGNYDNESLDSGQKTRNTDLLVLIRSALSRPFGRTSLPAHLAKTWVVEVSSAGFDKSRNMCTYNVMVQKEEYNDAGTPIPSPLRSTFKNKLSLGKSFVAASIDRTLQDFLWLEEALRKEYHGSLIFPILSLALTSGTDWTTTATFDKESFAKGEWDPLAVSMQLLDDAVHSNEPVDAKLLAGWFSDVLNSVRGKGELILDHNFMDVDIIHSEAIESFLYKTSEPLPNPSRKKWGKSNASNSNWLLGDLKKALNLQETGQDDISSTLAGLVKANLQCLGIMDDDDLGYGNNRHAHDSDSLVLRRTKTGEDQENAEMWRGLIQSNGLRAQRFYIAVQKENTLRTMYQLRMLLERESLLSAAWKRFAISLSMLFAAEKDVEICKLEGLKPSSPSDPSRVGKTQVDENLRILARQKVDRSVPSLKVLSGMLNTYYADFSSVDPSLREYAEGVENLIKTNMDGGWQSQLKAMSPMILLNNSNHESSSNQHQYKADKYTMQERLSTNEEYMKSSIMQLCKAMKIRISRMGWKYFKMESGQVSLLLTSAEQVRSNLKSGRIRDASIMENEQSDNEKEAELVRVIMELGLKRKYKYQSVPKSSASSHTSSETSVISDFDKSHEGDNETLTTDDGGTIQSPLLESVMTVAREHSGRWNADVSEKILQGSGIPNVRMDADDKSKSLRLVSKLARALKESIDRCKDAVQLLKQVNIQPAQDQKIPIEQLRRSFLSDLALVFSGTCETGQFDPMYKDMLSTMGIDMRDSSGWLKTEKVRGGGQCGTLAMKYQHVRHHGSDDFFSRMSSRLKSYDILIEEIENYIWMHRVADYVEKHYSDLRADALAAWEKKTDITTAINIATKKRLTLLVRELKEKLEIIGNSVSYTSVKEAKERHLGSKALKAELELLAARRFQRLKATCAEHSLSIINEWALREESAAKAEIKILKETVQEIENNLRRDENAIKADGGAHLFASKMAGNTVPVSARSSVSSSRSRSSRSRTSLQ